MLLTVKVPGVREGRSLVGGVRKEAFTKLRSDCIV